MPSKQKLPKLAVWKFASCDGCQLSLLDLEDEFLDIAKHVEISYFLEASSSLGRGPFDLSLVDGSITTQEDRERIKQVRKRSRFLVTMGACATAGGIQALRNFKNIKEFLSIVYAKPEYISTLEHSTPISAHVPVDLELQGCPINKYQLLDVITSYLSGKPPNVPPHSVCMECKIQGNVCVMVAQGTPCLGPVTHTGCGALCPRFNRGCYGCYGPKETPNTASFAEWCMQELGSSAADMTLKFRKFYAFAPAFHEASLRYEGKENGQNQKNERQSGSKDPNDPR